MSRISIEDIAKVAHEVNRAYCATIGDNSQPSWEEAPQWQRDSAVSGVKHIAGGYVTAAAESHGSWCAHKLLHGWKYGPVKDERKKEHPCLVPYRKLPAEQRAKDHLFFAVVKALLSTRS